MTRTSHRNAGLAALLALLATLQPHARDGDGQDPGQPTFRSAASAVVVDAAVRDRSRRPITGLKAADFEVLDNGVPQQVDDVSYGKLPIDVTVALDVSHSVTGSLLERLRQGVVQLMDDLAKGDRLKLVLFNMRISRATDFTTDVKAVESALRGAAAGGGTSLFDAISVALVSSSSPDRRQLIVFFTDGSDTSSISTPATLSAVAERSRGTLRFVMPTTLTTASLAGPTGAGASPRPAIPPNPNYATLARLARETGGGIIPVGASTSLSSTFSTVLSEFRSAYVLYYSPRGVSRGGYHTIDVTVKREGATVEARRGYFGS